MTKRELTEKEVMRQVKTENLTHEKEIQGYRKVNLEIDTAKLTILALIYSIPVCIPFVLLFLKTNTIHIAMHERLLGLALICSFVVVHELIHGIVWGIFAENHFKSIEFGFVKQVLMPYCTCTEPLTKVQYLAGAMMPGLLLGIIPMILSIFTGSFMTLVIGVGMTLGAGGDMAVIMKLLTYKTSRKDVLCMDHPTGTGVILLEK